MSARDEDDEIETRMVAFQRRTVIIGAIALAIVVLLVFAAGLLTGIGVVTSNQGKAKPTAKTETSAMPTPMPAPTPAPALVQATRPEPALTPMPAVETPKPAAMPATAPEAPAKIAAKPAAKPEPKPRNGGAKPATSRPTPSAVGAGGQYFTVQTGSFSEAATAARAAEALRKKGFDAEATQGIDTSGKAWHVVRVGKFADRKSAGAHATKLKSDQKIDGMIVKVGANAPTRRS